LIPQSISDSLSEAARKHVAGKVSYMYSDQSEMSRAAATTFNAL